MELSTKRPLPHHSPTDKKAIGESRGLLNIPFSKVSIGEEESEAVQRVLRSGWLAAGPETEAFEKEFAEYITPKPADWDYLNDSKIPRYYCIFTNSCTSALKMAYNILKEIGFTGICYPKNTFVATYSAAAELGLDICSYGGYDGSKGDICQRKNMCVHNAISNLKTNSILIDENSVLSNVTEKVGKECGSLLKQNLKKENIQTQKQSSRKCQKSFTQKSQDIMQFISGLREPMGKLFNAINADQVRVSDGQTKIIDIEESEKSGKDFVINVIIPSISESKIARVNMAYGGVKDETPCILEDSAHRIEPNDKLIGLMRCYSFYATKNLTTGSGGMFVTDNKEIYEIARKYWKDGISSSTYERQHGKSWDYSIKRLVSGYDGNDIAAAIGRVQLRKLPTFSKRRREIRDRYNNAFGQQWEGTHLYPFFVKNEQQVGKLIEYLKSKGISSGYHYPGPHKWLGISLPIYPLLTDVEVGYIIDSIKDWESKNGKHNN
jgi:dTDP-4-amino-4,6-dideoxygalactose transaminase